MQKKHVPSEKEEKVDIDRISVDKIRRNIYWAEGRSWEAVYMCLKLFTNFKCREVTERNDQKHYSLRTSPALLCTDHIG